MGVGIPGYNVSEQYKFLWLAPSRTGSRTLAEIFTFYDFKFDGKPVFMFNQYNYSHISPNLEQFGNYKIICGARNPYGRLYSHFENYAAQFQEKTKENFKKYVEMGLWNQNNLHQPILNKKPDYIVRLEHLREDLVKIPFIFDKLNPKQLDLLLDHGKTLEPWEHHYDDDIKEIVYKSFENHFIFWNYEK